MTFGLEQIVEAANKQGGPAFPSYHYNDAYKQMMAQGGMTLRDYFASKVLMGMFARDSFDPGQATPEQRSRLAYIQADAMIKERAK